ncbi:MAG: TetR/AcrR family transcriptional regulator [Dictyoglomaceae bacterium]
MSKEPNIRRQELIETALRLFLTKGYEKTSVRDILKEVKGSPGMFYYYFSSKEEIFESAIHYYVENYIKELSQIFKDDSLSLQEKYNKIVSAVIKVFEDLKSLSDVYYSPQYFPLRVKISFKILDGLTVPFSELLEKIKKNKDINSKKISTFILYGVYGLLHQDVENKKRPENIQEIMKFIVELTRKILGIPLNP